MAVKAESVKTSLRGTVTESASNTFTESTIDTNLSIRGDHIFIITGVWFQSSGHLVGDSDAVTLQLTYSPQSAIITPNDPDWLAGWKMELGIATQGGGTFAPIQRVSMDSFPIATAMLYLGAQAQSLAAATTNAVKIEGYHQRVSTTEYFRLAQSR